MNEDRENILIVDDAPDNLRLLAGILEKEGYRARPVPSGRLALSGARAIPPDLILLDVNMPEMDGYAVCRRLKADEATSDIPVVFISALTETFDKVKAFETGGVDYITKPFQLEEVLARVKTHLTVGRLQKRLARTNRNLEQQVATEQRLNRELQEALDRIQVLSGLIPICANCKNIRDDAGFWHQIEVYIREHSDMDFSHSICPDCQKLLYPELFDDETGSLQS